ncbi:hypothetical protein [Rhodococcus sp. IEGM 1318]|uniref:hypothetical protein n=1 Tax=Rhodococcus sp. IEGM 1318 TaxID=3082226 RepID=UPI002954F844|nr:hypothetical protein [Rhodococcus sp. IEGM 1318]MDV8007762.1 hypothetical protein [Rhodococcus sp. IEGM 1318]
MNKILVAVLGAGALLLTGCGSDHEGLQPGAVTSTSAAAPTSVKILTSDEKFMLRLQANGMFPAPDKVQLLTPAASGYCDQVPMLNLPDSQKFDQLVTASMDLGEIQGIDLFEDRPTTERFVRASIESYCPQLGGILPRA